MKKLLALALVAMMAGAALAQPASSEDNMMGMFFSDVEFTDGATNHVNAFAPFFGYVVLLNPTVPSIGGYELGIALDPSVFVLGVSGPNGWTNFGNNTNHLAGYTSPVPASDAGTVMASLNMLYTGTATIFIGFGPSEPSSLGDWPAIANGENPDELIACPLTSDGGYVATINGDGVVATESMSFTGVKALFD